MKKTWMILKDVINKNRQSRVQSQFKISDGSTISNKQMISEKFNDFFINIGPSLADKITKQDKSQLFYLGNKLENSIFIEPVSAPELDDILKTLTKCAQGYDEINIGILNLCLPCVKHSLLYISNLSLLHGVFPNELKIANVLPLFKSDDPMQFNNYRPVSLLSILSKIFEKAMYSRLVNLAQTLHKILCEKQFGFRKKHPTYMAPMILVDKLIKSLENGEYVLGVFSDFSKAFDTVDHSILLSKMYHYGIRGVAFKWFQSYLADRQQYVTYNGVQSSKKLIKCGVPQGSILRHILFLLYINDLVKACSTTLPYIFADDTNLFISGKNLTKMAHSLNKELLEISLWLKINKLSLNVNKTHYMLFTKKRKDIPCISINIDGQPIDEVESTRFLGVILTIDWHGKSIFLTYQYISGKVSRGIGVIVRARRVLNSDALLTLYYSFIYPFLTYCNHMWGSAYATSLKPLLLLQKRSVRIITFSGYRDHTDPLFYELGLLKISDINKYVLGKFMYRWYTKQIRCLFNSLFQTVRDVHEYDTRQSCHLHIPIVKTNLGKCELSCNGTVLYNKYPKSKYQSWNVWSSICSDSKTLHQNWHYLMDWCSVFVIPLLNIL